MCNLKEESSTSSQANADGTSEAALDTATSPTLPGPFQRMNGVDHAPNANYSPNRYQPESSATSVISAHFPDRESTIVSENDSYWDPIAFDNGSLRISEKPLWEHFRSNETADYWREREAQKEENNRIQEEIVALNEKIVALNKWICRLEEHINSRCGPLFSTKRMDPHEKMCHVETESGKDAKAASTDMIPMVEDHYNIDQQEAETHPSNDEREKLNAIINQRGNKGKSSLQFRDTEPCDCEYPQIKCKTDRTVNQASEGNMKLSNRQQKRRPSELNNSCSKRNKRRDLLLCADNNRPDLPICKTCSTRICKHVRIRRNNRWHNLSQ